MDGAGLSRRPDQGEYRELLLWIGVNQMTRITFMIGAALFVRQPLAGSDGDAYSAVANIGDRRDFKK